MDRMQEIRERHEADENEAFRQADAFGGIPRFPRFHTDRAYLIARVEKLERLRDVVRENYNQCRIIGREEVERRMAAGGEIMGVPHEECLDAIDEALTAADAMEETVEGEVREATEDAP